MASILSVTSTMSPQLAARIAYPMFVTPSPRRELRPEERRIMDEARESHIRVRSSKLNVYEWKKGPDVVLLVHGWQGRASQFNVLVRSLRARGFTVVAFDAPACGASEGSTTDIADYIDAMRKLQRIYGPFAGVVGHSFGALAALSAINEGLDARRVVGVGTIPDAAFLLSSFAERLQLSKATINALAERFQFTRSLGDIDIRDRFSGLKNPITCRRSSSTTRMTRACRTRHPSSSRPPTVRRRACCSPATTVTRRCSPRARRSTRWSTSSPRTRTSPNSEPPSSRPRSSGSRGSSPRVRSSL